MRSTAPKISSSLPQRNLLGEDLVEKHGIDGCPGITSPEDIARLFGDIANLSREVMVAGSVDGQMRLLSWRLLGVGSNDYCSIHCPGDAFADVVRKSGTGIFLVHNHPAGTLIPSKFDLQFTNIVAEAGLLLGYRLFDHVIVTRSGFLSILDEAACGKFTKYFRTIAPGKTSRVNKSARMEWRCRRCTATNVQSPRFSAEATAKTRIYLPARCHRCRHFYWLNSAPINGA
jgi:hypothetical protein